MRLSSSSSSPTATGFNSQQEEGVMLFLWFSVLFRLGWNVYRDACILSFILECMWELMWRLYVSVVGFDVAGEKKCLNSELWHVCAGPLVSLPQIGSRVVYFPQGHSEQVLNSYNNCKKYLLLIEIRREIVSRLIFCLRCQCHFCLFVLLSFVFCDA